MGFKKFITLTIFFFSVQQLAAQDTAQHQPTQQLFDSSNNVNIKDSTPVITANKDSVPARKKHDPHKATLRSAIIPGWGQAYNREYWKIPIVYGALSIPAILYFYNDNYYKKTRFAYQAVYAAQVLKDTSLLDKIDPKVKNKDGSILGLNDYQRYRNDFKRNKDYSILYFLLVWGLNVVDATVFGHLKDFDVSDDLSMHVIPSYDPAIKKPALSLVFNFKSPSHKLLSAAK